MKEQMQETLQLKETKYMYMYKRIEKCLHTFNTNPGLRRNGRSKEKCVDIVQYG